MRIGRRKMAIFLAPLFAYYTEGALKAICNFGFVRHLFTESFPGLQRVFLGFRSCTLTFPSPEDMKAACAKEFSLQGVKLSLAPCTKRDVDAFIRGPVLEAIGKAFTEVLGPQRVQSVTAASKGVLWIKPASAKAAAALKGTITVDGKGICHIVSDTPKRVPTAKFNKPKLEEEVAAAEKGSCNILLPQSCFTKLPCTAEKHDCSWAFRHFGVRNGQT